MKCIRLIKERVFLFNLYQSTFVKEAPKGPNYMKIIKTNMKKEEVNCTFWTFNIYNFKYDVHI